MENSKAKKSIKNLIAAIVSQGVVLILGLIIPRLTITGYGSETNGYMSFVSQIYAYIALLESGLSVAVVQALYKPIAGNDKKTISGIVNAARDYYRKIAVYYTLIVIFISVVLPFIVDSSLSKWEMGGYFALFGLSNVVNFWFTAAWRPILVADGKNYVNSNITLIFHFFSQFAKIALLFLQVNIVVLQLAYTTINILQIVVYYIYFRKKYRWLDKNEQPLQTEIKQRSAFFIQQVSHLIFSCTDVVLISIICDLKAASVYAVYFLIFNAISTLVSHFTSSTQFVLGQTWNENREKYIKIHRLYESSLVTLSFILFSAAQILTIPFMRLYTAGVSDAEYIDYVLPILFSVNGLLTICRATSLHLINFSFHAKQTINRTIIEASLNIVVTLSLIWFMQIRGALIGTGVALLFRTIELIFYVNKKILHDSIIPQLKLYLSNFALFAVAVFVSFQLDLHLKNYLEFFVSGLIAVIICGAAFILLNFAISPGLFKKVSRMVLKKKN